MCSLRATCLATETHKANKYEEQEGRKEGRAHLYLSACHFSSPVHITDTVGPLVVPPM